MLKENALFGNLYGDRSRITSERLINHTADALNRFGEQHTGGDWDDIISEITIPYHY